MHTHRHTCTRTHACTHTHAHTRMHTHMHAHADTHRHTHTQTCMLAQAHTHTYVAESLFVQAGLQAMAPRRPAAAVQVPTHPSLGPHPPPHTEPPPHLKRVLLLRAKCICCRRCWGSTKLHERRCSLVIGNRGHAFGGVS